MRVVVVIGIDRPATTRALARWSTRSARWPVWRQGPFPDGDANVAQVGH